MRRTDGPDAGPPRKLPGPAAPAAPDAMRARPRQPCVRSRRPSSSMRRPLVLLCAWLALLPPERAAAEARLVFGSSDGVAEFPFELHNNHINVRGRIGDSDSLWIVLDSGASGASVSASRAKSLGLAIQGGGTAQGAGGSVESGRVPNATIRLPGLELLGQDLSS